MLGELNLTNWDITKNETVYTVHKNMQEVREISGKCIVNDLFVIRFDIHHQKSFFGNLFNKTNYLVSPYFCIHQDFLFEQEIPLINTDGAAYIYMSGTIQKKFNAYYHEEGEWCFVRPIVENNDIYDFIANNDAFSLMISFNGEKNNKKYEYDFERNMAMMIDNLNGIYLFKTPLLDNNDKSVLISAVNYIAMQLI